MKTLTADQVARYRRDGFVSPVTALTPEEALSCRRRLEASEAALGGPFTELDRRYRYKSHLLFTWADELVNHPAILDAVEDLLGPDLLCFTTTMFLKEPRSPTIAAWHQDWVYFGLRPHEQLEVWVALSEASPESGCMEFLPGSQGLGELRHGSQMLEHSVNEARQGIAGPLAEAGAVAGPLKPGQFSVHHTLCVHRSGPNRTDDRRLGFGISYIPTHVRHIGTKRMSAMLVRGADRYGHFDLEERPRADLDDAARAEHDRVYARYREGFVEQQARHEGASAA